MPTKIYHKDHGFVLTNNSDEIAELVAKGGKVVIKSKEAFLPDPTVIVNPARTKRKGE